MSLGLSLARLGLSASPLALAAGVTPPPTPDPAYTGPDYLISSGATSVIYGHVLGPTAVHYADLSVTLCAYEVETAGSQRQQRVIGVNPSTGAILGTQSLGLAGSIGNEDHTIAALFRASDGRFWAWGNCHDSPCRISSSSAANDWLGTWASRGSIGANLSYPNPINVDDGGWLFARKQSGSQSQTMPLVRYRYTNISGTTLTPATPTEEPCVEFGSDARVYQFGEATPGRKIIKLLQWANYADTARRDQYFVVFDKDNPTQISNLSGTRVDTLPVTSKAVLDTWYREINQTARGAWSGGAHFCLDSNGDLWCAYLDYVSASDGLADPRNVLVQKFDMTSKAWGAAEQVSAIQAAGRYTSVAILQNPAGEIEVSYAGIPTFATPWERAGDWIVAVRSTGGAWTAERKIQLAATDLLPIDRAMAVKNAHANLRFFCAEAAMSPSVGGTAGATSSNMHGGVCALYGWGAGGFIKTKRVGVHAQTAAAIARGVAPDTDFSKKYLDKFFDGIYDNSVQANVGVVLVERFSRYPITAAYDQPLTPVGGFAAWQFGIGFAQTGGPGYVALPGYTARAPMSTTASSMGVFNSIEGQNNSWEFGFTSTVGQPFAGRVRGTDNKVAIQLQGITHLGLTNTTTALIKADVRRTGGTSMEIWTSGTQSAPANAAVAGLPDGELRFYALELSTPANRKFEYFFEGNGMNDFLRNIVANSARRLAKAAGGSV